MSIFFMHILTVLSNFKDWIDNQISLYLYTNHEIYYIVKLQRRVKRMLYLRRCKSTQTESIEQKQSHHTQKIDSWHVLF